MSKFRRSSSSSYGNWMSAVVKFRAEKVGCLPILEDGTTDDKNVVVVHRKNVPDNLFEGRHGIQLSQDKKSIIAFKPYSGQHTAKFVEFTHKEHEPPIPTTQRGEYGDYLVCWALFEILEGQYKGCQTTLQVPYKFKEGNDGITEFDGVKGKFLERLDEFLDAVIGLFDPPPFTDNLLPGLQKLALRANKTILLTFKKGFIVTLEAMEGTAKPKPKKDDNPPWEQEPDTE